MVAAALPGHRSAELPVRRAVGDLVIQWSYNEFILRCQIAAAAAAYIQVEFPVCPHQCLQLIGEIEGAAVSRIFYNILSKLIYQRKFFFIPATSRTAIDLGQYLSPP